MGTQPKVISTFAGCGGSSLGYKMAGFKELLAIDFDRNAVETFKLNFPGIPVWREDVRKVTPKRILDFCKIKKGQLDVLDGSPPCQGFSTSGKREVADPRNDLFKSFVRLIRGLRPRVFVMENVPGMIKGRMKGRFIEIMRELKSTGYNVKCKLMNSANYGVPQSRERLVWIGSREVVPSFPSPSSKIITVRDALADCPEGIYYNIPKTTKIYQYIMKLRQGECGSRYHEKGHFFDLRRLKWSKPAYTITKNGGRMTVHPDLDRFITDREAARLSSFPDGFVFIGRAVERIARIGNAVMPKFMEAIARHVKKEILGKNPK